MVVFHVPIDLDLQSNVTWPGLKKLAKFRSLLEKLLIFMKPSGYIKKAFWTNKCTFSVNNRTFNVTVKRFGSIWKKI